MEDVFGNAPYPPSDSTHPSSSQDDQVRKPFLDLGNDLIGWVPESMSGLDGVAAVFELPSGPIRESMDVLHDAPGSFGLIAERYVVGNQRIRILAVRQDGEEPYLVSPSNEQRGGGLTRSHRGLGAVRREQNLHRWFPPS